MNERERRAAVKRLNRHRSRGDRVLEQVVLTLLVGASLGSVVIVALVARVIWVWGGCR